MKGWERAYQETIAHSPITQFTGTQPASLTGSDCQGPAGLGVRGSNPGSLRGFGGLGVVAHSGQPSIWRSMCYTVQNLRKKKVKRGVWSGVCRFREVCQVVEPDPRNRASQSD